MSHVMLPTQQTTLKHFIVCQAARSDLISPRQNKQLAVQVHWVTSRQKTKGKRNRQGVRLAAAYCSWLGSVQSQKKRDRESAQLDHRTFRRKVKEERTASHSAAVRRRIDIGDIISSAFAAVQYYHERRKR